MMSRGGDIRRENCVDKGRGWGEDCGDVVKYKILDNDNNIENMVGRRIINNREELNMNENNNYDLVYREEIGREVLNVYNRTPLGKIEDDIITFGEMNKIEGDMKTEYGDERFERNLRIMNVFRERKQI